MKIFIFTMMFLYLFLYQIAFADTILKFENCSINSKERQLILSLNKPIIDILLRNFDDNEKKKEICIKIIKYDLNCDGEKEILYVIDDRMLCGRGCYFGIISKINNKYRKIGNFMVDFEITIKDTKHHSFNDIILSSGSKINWNGNEYE